MTQSFDEWKENLSMETSTLYSSLGDFPDDYFGDHFTKALDKCRKEAYDAGSESRQEEINDLKNKLREIIIND